MTTVEQLRLFPVGQQRIGVDWVGDRPDWVELPERRAGELTVVHARADELEHLSPRPERLVADLSGATHLSPRAIRAARLADAVVVADPAELQLLGGPADVPTVVVHPPVDLTRFAPEPVLRERSDRRVRRFRRLHRLPEHLLLFAGPYTRDGGLDLFLDAALPLAAGDPTVAVAAIPFGAVDRRCRDAADRRLFALGARGILEWRVEESELPLWLAAAVVVCVPAGVPTEPIVLAAAAGTPSVAAEGVAAELLPLGMRPLVVAPGDAAGLAERLEQLLRGAGWRLALGAVARAAAERELTQDGATANLQAAWRLAARA